MSDSVIYDNIFEAVRQLDPNNIILRALNNIGGVVLHQNYEIIEFPDGTTGAIIPSLNMAYYRGEHRAYDSCKASVYRIKNKTERMLAELKTIEFTQYLCTLDNVKRAIENNEHVDLLAMAQHYGFATNIIDVTNDLLTAAFFATHERCPYRNIMAVVAEGIGQIRWSTELFGISPKLRLIGRQPLDRPGNQTAYGICIPESEDYALQSGAIKFRQNPRMNQLFHSSVISGADYFFPPDPLMEAVVGIIKSSCCYTSMAIDEYCNTAGVKYEAVSEMIKENNGYVVDAPLVCHNMPITYYENVPGGDVRVKPMFIMG